MVFHLNRKHRRSECCALLVLYMSSLVFSVQAGFGDRLPAAAALEQSYLPPTPVDADRALGSSAGSESTRASPAATGDAPGTEASADAWDGFGVAEPGGLGQGGATGALGAVEAGEPGADVPSGSEAEQTGGVGVDGTGAGRVTEAGETSVTPLGSEADDGIPGRAGIDYPTLAALPDTGFSCENYALPGYYVDKETECQVFYVCQMDGRQDGFLCPNGTKFNQQFLVCDWWYNVDCSIADSFFTINERIYAGPGSRAVEFPDQDGDKASPSQQLPTAVDGLREDSLGTDAPRGEFLGDVTVPAPYADSTVAPGDYDGISSDYNEGPDEESGGSSTTEGAIRDYEGGSTDYDGVGTGELSSTQNSLGVPGDGSRGNDDSYSYLPPDEFFPTEAVEGVRGATGENITPNARYGIPSEFPTLSPNSRGFVINESEGELDSVTPYSYALPDAKTRASPKDDEEDSPGTSSAFDESTIEAILSYGDNFGGFPNNAHSGYSYLEPLNPLNFESAKNSFVPESSTFVSAAGNRDESEPTSAPGAASPLTAEGILNGSEYSPPAPLPSNSTGGGVVASPTEGRISNTRAGTGNGYNGYSYPEPARPFLLPGESPGLPPLETYLPPSAR